MSDDKTYVKHVKTGEVFEVIHGSPPLCRAVWDKNGEEHVFIDDMLTPYDPDADVRKRCEQVFRDATGHPSFIGRDGVDLRDVFAEMIRAAYLDGQRAGMEQAAKMAQEKAERSIKGEHLNIPEYNFGYRGGLRGLADEIRLQLHTKIRQAAGEVQP